MKRPELSQRQAQVVERVARGLSYKVIAAELGISIRTVHAHVEHAAARIPGDSAPRHRLTLFFFNVDESAA
jgi:DNA-binding NarL/FixJ family response regulator